MSAGELDGDAPPRPFRGFRSNADDTPRDLEHQPVYDDPFHEAEPEFWTFEPPHDELTFQPLEADESRTPMRGLGRTTGVALLVLAVVGAGVALTRGSWTPETPAPARETSTPALRAEVAPPPPAGTNVEGLVAQAAPPPTLALSESALRRQELAETPPRPSTPSVRPTQIAEEVPKFVDPEVSADVSASVPAPAAPVPLLALPALAPVRPSFDCQGQLTRAQQMVCGDPRLAAADRRLSQAFSAALAAGGPHDQLRSEQGDWLAIREDAARYSNRAMLNIYEQRTRELEALTGERPD